MVLIISWGAQALVMVGLLADIAKCASQHTPALQAEFCTSMPPLDDEIGTRAPAFAPVAKKPSPLAEKAAVHTALKLSLTCTLSRVWVTVSALTQVLTFVTRAFARAHYF